MKTTLFLFALLNFIAAVCIILILYVKATLGKLRRSLRFIKEFHMVFLSFCRISLMSFLKVKAAVNEDLISA
jgi:hypothetical protein